MAPMRDDIHDAILKGGATRESLLALTGTTEKGLASQFTYLRMTGRCPMKQEDGTFKIVSTEEWEAHRASAGTRAAANLTPEERVERNEKRSKRAAAAYDNAKKRRDADPENRLNELKFIKADAELQIAEIELGKAEEAFANEPSEEVEATEPGDDDVVPGYDEGDESEEAEYDPDEDIE